MSAEVELRKDLTDDGAARLLRALLRRGLPLDSLAGAARLVAALEQAAAERREHVDQPTRPRRRTPCP